MRATGMESGYAYLERSGDNSAAATKQRKDPASAKEKIKKMETVIRGQINHFAIGKAKLPDTDSPTLRSKI